MDTGVHDRVFAAGSYLALAQYPSAIERGGVAAGLAPQAENWNKSGSIVSGQNGSDAVFFAYPAFKMRAAAAYRLYIAACVKPIV
ncbi:hypothetical protein D3C80_1315370 [compost metagenome]